VELVSALTVATILVDAAVTPTVSEMTYNVSSGTLNHTQPTINLQKYTWWSAALEKLEMAEPRCVHSALL